MKKIYIEPINYVLKLENPIDKIYIDNQVIYRTISLKLSDNFILSINNNNADLEKNTLIIYNPFELNINDPKLIKALYKKLELKILSPLNETFNSIETKLFEFINELTFDEMPLDFEKEIDVKKLFSCLGILYYESEDYLERLVNYIKVYNDVFKNSFIISFGLTNLLKEDEEQLLTRELKLLNINLVDIIFCQKNKQNTLYIDDDWCII